MAPVLSRSPTAADPLGEVLSRYLLTGDEEALETVVRETRPRLLAAARRIGDPQDAEDAVQSAYLSLVRKRGGPLGAPVFPWLLTAVVRIAYRRKAVDRREADLARRLALPPEGTSPWRDAAESEGAERLRREVDRLPERYRDPVVLHDLHGLSAAEAGRLLDLPEATVRTRVRRARLLLRWRLSPGLVLGVLAIPWFLRDMAGSAAGGGAAAAAMGGAMKIGGLAAIVAAAAGVGALVGAKVLGGTPAEEVEARVRAEQEKATRAAEDSRDLREKVKAAEERAAKAESLAARKAEDLAAEMRRFEEAMAEAQKALKAARGGAVDASASTAQPFSFPEYDEVLAKVDWKSVGTATSQMLPVLSTLRESVKSGGKPDFTAFGKIQQLNGALIKEAGKIHETLPGTGVNGAFTHPSFMVNSIASTLEEAGKPLSAQQHDALARVGREYSDRERTREAGYDDRTLGLQKVVDEATLKDQFFDGAAGVLAPEQRDVLWPPATKGLLGFDLYSSGLMLATVMQPLVVKDRDAYLQQVEKAVADRMGIPEDCRAALRGLVAAWAVEVPGSWFEKNTESLGGMQPLFAKDLVLDVARGQVGLMQKIVSDLGLDAAKADQVRKSPVILVPLVKQGP